MHKHIWLAIVCLMVSIAIGIAKDCRQNDRLDRLEHTQQQLEQQGLVAPMPE